MALRNCKPNVAMETLPPMVYHHYTDMEAAQLTLINNLHMHQNVRLLHLWSFKLVAICYHTVCAPVFVYRPYLACFLLSQIQSDTIYCSTSVCLKTLLAQIPPFYIWMSFLSAQWLFTSTVKLTRNHSSRRAKCVNKGKNSLDRGANILNDCKMTNNDWWME